MLNDDVFNSLWPSMQVILQALNLPAEALRQINQSHIRAVKEYENSKGPNQGMPLFLFAKSWFASPMEASLWYQEKRSGISESLQLFIYCEAYSAPRENGDTHRLLVVVVRPESIEVVNGGVTRFPLHFIPGPGPDVVPLHKLLTGDYFTPLMRQAISPLLDLTRESFAAAKKS